VLLLAVFAFWFGVAIGWMLYRHWRRGRRGRVTLIVHIVPKLPKEEPAP